MFGNTIDNIVSDITKKVSQLRAHADKQEAKGLKHAEKANIKLTLASIAHGEKDRALRLARRFEELVA